MIIRKSNEVETKKSLQDGRNCKESRNVEKTFESKYPSVEGTRGTVEKIIYTDLSTIIQTNCFSEYRPARLQYFNVQYKIEGWNQLFEKTIQLLKRDYPLPMSDIRERALFYSMDRAVIRLQKYLKRCWVSEENVKVGLVVNEDYFHVDKNKQHQSLKTSAMDQDGINKKVVASEKNANSKRTQVKQASSVKAWSLLEYLDSKKVRYVDKTNKGGCVWIIGGPELTPIVEECRNHGINFTYSERGGLASDKKPAWWARLT